MFSFWNMLDFFFAAGFVMLQPGGFPVSPWTPSESPLFEVNFHVALL